MYERDVYEWLDPVEERDKALYWREGCKYERARTDERLSQMREQHRHKTAVLQAHNEHLMKLICETTAYTMPLIFVAKPSDPKA